MAVVRLGPADYTSALNQAGVGHVMVFHHQTTGSTSDDARTLGESDGFDNATSIGMVIAETQTKGRGRGANTWFSPEGSIAFTVTLPSVAVERLGVFPLGVGTCVARSLKALGADPALKWPNDLLIAGLKVGGILCESSILGGSARVFIGIGLNVGTGVEDPGLAPQATTLTRHGLVVDRPALVADITARILALAADRSSNANIVDGFKSLAVPWWGEAATLVEGENEKRVTLLDVNPHGQLVVRDEAGVVRSLVSGDVRRLRVTRT